MEYNRYTIGTRKFEDLSKYFTTLRMYSVEITNLTGERISSHNIGYNFFFIATEENYKAILKELHIKERRT